MNAVLKKPLQDNFRFKSIKVKLTCMKLLRECRANACSPWDSLFNLNFASAVVSGFIYAL